jgi:hypothetical protein
LRASIAHATKQDGAVLAPRSLTMCLLAWVGWANGCESLGAGTANR